MSETHSAASEVPGPKPDRVPRGSTPPALKLSEAMVLSRKINDNAGGSASYDLFSQITGNTKTSSSFVRKVAALRQYGIIEDRDNAVALSELGNRMSTPRDEIDDATAAKESLLRIDLLHKVYDRHCGRLLPEDQFLANILIQEFKVPREFSRLWVDHFKDAISSARLLFVRPDGKAQLLEVPKGSSSNSAASLSVVDDVVTATQEPSKTTNKVVDFGGSLPIPLGPGRLAFIKLPDDWNAPKDLRRLVKMLELSLGEESEEDKYS